MDENNKKKKEETSMPALAPKLFPELDLNVEKTRQSSETLKVKNGVVQLDPKNEFHRDWFENDEDYDI